MQNHSMTIGVDGDGGVTFADGRYLIRKVAPPLPGFDAEGLALPSGDGLEVYEFDRNGRHLRTRDGLTGAVLKTFEYDAAKRLVGIVDAYGNRTRIERDGGRHGDRDRRPRRPAHDAGDQRRRLARVASPTRPREAYRFTYHDAGGLLASFKKPERRAPPASTTTRVGRLTAPPRRRRRGAHADPHRGRVRPDA